MNTITEQTKFDQILENEGEHIFFVHSNWAIQSVIGLNKLKELKEKFPDLELTIIDNSEAEGFVYEWLTDEKNNHLIVDHRPAVPSWIHGNGELFMVQNKLINWFRRATKDLLEEELISLLNLKNPE